jgi:hypothetical protein
MRRLRVVLPLLALAACSPLRGCVESQFSLAPDSRLPQWFAVPVVKDRSDVTVKLTYWTNGDAEFDLKNRWGITIRDVTGPSCWHPRTRYRHHADGTQSPPGGPEFVIVKVGGSVDVIEHKQLTPVFRMSDDPEILREARESIARGECRHEP